MSSSPSWPSKVAVVGAAGLIGSGVLEHLAVGDLADDIYAIDVRENVVLSHVIDIRESQIIAGASRATLHTEPPPPGTSVDLVFVAASAAETPDGDRRGFLRANLKLLQRIVPSIESLAGDTGLVVLLSNPVDVLAECLVALSSIGRERVLGYSFNDSVRFRAALGRELGVAPTRIDAMVLGEHGPGQVPLFSSVAVDGVTRELDEAQRQRVRADVDGWFGRWSALKPGRSSGWTTPRGVAATVRMMRDGDIHPAVVPVSIDGAEAFVGVPVRLSQGKVVVELGPLAVDEREGLRRAAESVAHASAEALEEIRSAP
jgi:malate dehydrogenase